MVATLPEVKRTIRDQICSKLPLASGKDSCSAGPMETSQSNHWSPRILCQSLLGLLSCAVWESWHCQYCGYFDDNGTWKGCKYVITMLKTCKFYHQCVSLAVVLRHDWKAPSGAERAHRDTSLLIWNLRLLYYTQSLLHLPQFIYLVHFGRN